MDCLSAHFHVMSCNVFCARQTRGTGCSHLTDAKLHTSLDTPLLPCIVCISRTRSCSVAFRSWWTSVHIDPRLCKALRPNCLSPPRFCMHSLSLYSRASGSQLRHLGALSFCELRYWTWIFAISIQFAEKKVNRFLKFFFYLCSNLLHKSYSSGRSNKII